MTKLITLKQHFYLLIPIAVFVAVKVFSSGFYLSDSGNYFYVAYQMLHGQFLYSDIFFADLPLLPLLSIIYYLISFGNLWVFNFIPVIEVVVIACLIYYLAYQKSRELLVSMLSASLFLFSALIFMCSAAQYFIFTACLFALLGYLFAQRKNPVLAGFFLALAFLTKAYFLPIIIAALIAAFIKNKFKFTLTLGISFLITCVTILLPFILLSGNAMWKDIIAFSLRGERYFPISDLISFFIYHETILAVLLIFSVIFIRRDYFTGLVSIGFVLLIFLYGTMQPLYMVMIIPFLCLYLPNFFALTDLLPKSFSKEFKQDLRGIMLPLIIILYLGFALFYYGIIKANVSRVPDINNLISQTLAQKPDYIYGDDSICPSLAYLTNTPLLDNQVNTDGALFSANILNSKAMTEEALAKRTEFIVLGTLDANGGMRTINPMFDLASIAAAPCNTIGIYNVEGNLPLNKLFVFKCY